MFTTAGSTRLTIPAKELDDGIGSGTARAVAVVPENPILFIAETRPETTDPIRMPTASVNATNTAASILRRRAQLKSSLTCSPISVAPLVRLPQPSSSQMNVLPPAPIRSELAEERSSEMKRAAGAGLEEQPKWESR